MFAYRRGLTNGATSFVHGPCVLPFSPASSPSALGCGSASAQTTTAAHPASPPRSLRPTPHASAIIPGSPLAALTGAATTPAPVRGQHADPVRHQRDRAVDLQRRSASRRPALFGDFVTAVHQSTRLAPVLDWVRSFGHRAPPPRASARYFPGLGCSPFCLAWRLSGCCISPWRARVPRWRSAPRRGSRLPPARNTTTCGGGRRRRRRRNTGWPMPRPARRKNGRAANSPFLTWGWRFALGLLHFGLRLVPLIGFAVTVQVLISTSLIATRLGGIRGDRHRQRLFAVPAGAGIVAFRPGAADARPAAGAAQLSPCRLGGALGQAAAGDRLRPAMRWSR